ncbi:hypothetical protein F2Q70_00027116 [Brassica cretica]|uniref:Arf-GAP domain-containing protein n=1 Tax=Brassica cretica TaxID=69181 RepID=A0A8S9L6E4_BRACR|nr:hypothetical protein F2Q70_00027116 [Brassica cretica]
MAGGVKEDEKNERIIRSLLKLPDNKRCINCNSLGPQYVCTTFWTFVCTNCSGIHREFTHRVKSISMAKFTSQEVSALKEGGNQHAKDIYFKGLDQQRQSAPDGSNVERLRDFIRQVYVNKRYTNEKNDDKPPRGPMGDSETRSSSGSRSPPYEDAYERRYSDRSSPGGTSPGFEQGNRKSPSRPEVLNDWRREDRFGGRKKTEEESHSPEQVKDLGSASPPIARPVREILGDSVIPLRVIEPPKPQVNRNSDSSVIAKPTASSSSLTTTNENPPEVKMETAMSLIDFDADPEPPAPSVAIQAPISATHQPAAQPASASNDNWASFDAPITPSLNVSQPPPSGNSVDSLLSQLAAPSSGPVQTSTLSSGPAHLGHSTSQIFAPPPNGQSNEQLWNTGLSSNVQRSMSAPSLHPLRGVPSEVKPSGRTELPADLFTATYQSYHAAAPGWQAGPPHGMHYGMPYGLQQYNNTMPYQNVLQPASREFTHRVKSISMAKFTSQEVSALKEGGNQHAKDIYFKGLDQHMLSASDGSNAERLRDFIRQVYVNKRYTNVKNDDKPPRAPMGDSEIRSSSGSRSPPYDDVYDRRYSGRSSPGGKSPGFDQANRKSPSRPEIINDWCREDRFGGKRKTEEESHSPEQVKDSSSASPPVSRPVREILGDSFIPLRVIEPPKPQVNQNSDTSAIAKPAASSSSLSSTNEYPPEVKLETAISLIDFDADPEPPAPSVAIQAPISATTHPAVQPASANNDNWASFGAAPSAMSSNASQSPPSGNTVDSLLSQLTAASAVPVQMSSGPVHLGHSSSQIFAQPLNGHSREQVVSAPSFQPLQGVPPGGLQSSEVKPSGRTELPADLFTVTYPSYHAAAPGWHAGPPHGMHYGMQQYNNTVQPFQNVPQQGKSVNPFDLSSEPPTQTQPVCPPPYLFDSYRIELLKLAPTPSTEKFAYWHLIKRFISPQTPGNMPPRHLSPIGNMGAPYETQQAYQNFGSPFASAVSSNSPPSFSSGGNPFGSMNPFDFSSEPPSVTRTETMFPSIASLQGALPPSGMMPSQGLHNHFSMPPQVSGHPSAMPPRYISPQIPGSMPPRLEA